MILVATLTWGSLAQGTGELKEQRRSAIVDASWQVHGMSHNLCKVRGRAPIQRQLSRQVDAAAEQYEKDFGEDSGAGIIIEPYHYNCARRDRWREAYASARRAIRKIRQLEGR